MARLRRGAAGAVLSILVLALAALPAGAFETTARAAILIEDGTGQVLFAKQPDLAVPPASMSKLMTAFMVFERLKDGSLTLDTELLVSEKAWRKKGSKMFVEVGSRVRVEDLLRGIIIQSGNDACIVVAESLAGSEEAFAELMTERGKEIGLTASVFKNASGWPDPDHVMSVRDLANVARRIIHDHPENYHIYSEKSFEYNGIEQHSRNPLLRRNVAGVDGLKTGYTRDAGYGLVSSAERDGRRLVLVMAGLKTPGARRREAQALLEFGYREFQTYTLFTAGDEVETADVWLGEGPTVPLVAAEDVVVGLPRSARDSLEVTAIFDQPIPAPVEAGMQVGEVRVTADGMEPITVPLLAGGNVAAANLFGRVSSSLSHLLWGAS